MEIWKKVQGYEDYLEVSNLGRARTCDRVVRQLVVTPTGYKEYQDREIKGQECRYNLKKNGYIQVAVRLPGRKRKWFLLHRIVAIAFVPNPQPGVLIRVNHEDTIKTNNAASNLTWCTDSQNMQHAIDNRLLTVMGEKQWKAKLTNQKAVEIRASKKTKKELAVEYGVSAETIERILLRKSWRYAEQLLEEAKVRLDTEQEPV